jgi:uncharacterized repeat protein (TIGR01451 family)
MKSKRLLAALAVLWLILSAFSAGAQQHRAVRLGHPATRFAAPLTRPEQLRSLLAGEEYKDDVASILQQAGWKGNPDDLRRAAATAPITEEQLPIGTRMPFMSSRKDGRPVALMDVIWAGDAPVSAYAFDFSSNKRLCRCITPKACGNFYIVDVGEAKPDLWVECDVPGQGLVGRRFDVCLTVANKGTAVAPSASLLLKVPAQATRIGGLNRTPDSNGCFLWTITNLAPGTSSRACATFVSREPATLAFAATVQDTGGSSANSRCETQISGIPAILLETSDLDDPIEVGKEVVYEIKVTNQGSAPGTNLKVVCSLPESEEFVSGIGPTAVQARDRSVTMGILSVLAPKAQAVWRVRVKALKPDDARFKVFVSSDQFQQPIQKDESTHLY